MGKWKGGRVEGHEQVVSPKAKPSEGKGISNTPDSTGHSSIHKNAEANKI